MTISDGTHTGVLVRAQMWVMFSSVFIENSGLLNFGMKNTYKLQKKINERQIIKFKRLE